MNAAADNPPAIPASLQRFRQRLASGEPLLGPVLTLASAPVASLLAASGFDWLWIDLEHGAISLETALQMIWASRGTDAVPLVRVPWHEPWLVKPLLDAGAMGVITPMVETAAQAATAVAALRYPPAGVRGFAPTLAPARWGLSVADYAAAADGALLAIVQIETAAAVERIEEIVAVPGLDLVFVGMYDLSGSLGLLGQVDHPLVEAAALRVLEAARRAGVAAGTIALDPATIRRRLEQGFSFMAVATDGSLLTGSARQLLEVVRG